MKKIIKLTGLITLIVFSFFYTDKVITVINEQDPIMIELENIKDTYKTEPIEAYIDNDTIIPGLSGKEINIEKSYNNMKSIGKFTKSLIIYDEILPKETLDNNKDKYIIKGNPQTQAVSILIIPKENTNLEEIETIISNKNITINYFIDYNYLIKNSNTIKNLKNAEVYSYDEDKDTLLFSNNLITRITNNDAIYCLTEEKNNNILQLCQKNNLYTIIPNIITESDAYSDIKNNLTSGSIILLNTDTKTINNLSMIIDYIEGKGLKIKGLKELLKETLN